MLRQYNLACQNKICSHYTCSLRCQLENAPSSMWFAVWLFDFTFLTALKRAAEQITVIEPKRARNLGKEFSELAFNIHVRWIRKLWSSLLDKQLEVALIYTAVVNNLLHFYLPVIARRRIQHSTETIGTLIDQCDLVELPPEHAELLLKFVPTKEEVSK